MQFNIVMIIVIVAISSWPIPAFAYIDPGTGSILIQGIIGAIAAIGVTLKLYWHRIVAIFRRQSSEEPASRDARKAEVASDGDDT